MDPSSNPGTAPPNEWVARWTARQIQFHEADVNQFLKMNEPLLFPDDTSRRVFVPMAGKTVDIPYLVGKGHTVIAIEFVEQAVREFFEDTKLSFTKTDLGNEIIKYEAADGKIEFYLCDFFNPHFNSSLIGPIDRVWDRGSLIAMKTETLQPQYVAKMKELLKTNSSSYTKDLVYLLCTVEYPTEEMRGPPFCVPEKMVIDYFGEDFTIQALQKELNETLRQARKVSVLYDETFLLKPK